MAAPIWLRLDCATRRAVSARHAQTRNAVERTNCQMVLQADEGRSAQEIAWLVRRRTDQVRSSMHRFQGEGVAELAPRTEPRRAFRLRQPGCRSCSASSTWTPLPG